MVVLTCPATALLDAVAIDFAQVAIGRVPVQAIAALKAALNAVAVVARGGAG